MSVLRPGDIKQHKAQPPPFLYFQHLSTANGLLLSQVDEYHHTQQELQEQLQGLEEKFNSLEQEHKKLAEENQQLHKDNSSTEKGESHLRLAAVSPTHVTLVRYRSIL